MSERGRIVWRSPNGDVELTDGVLGLYACRKSPFQSKCFKWGWFGWFANPDGWVWTFRFDDAVRMAVRWVEGHEEYPKNTKLDARQRRAVIVAEVEAGL